jgi:hypothetical protein
MLRTSNDSLATELRATSGFDYDPFFIPDTDIGHNTYAQITSEEKTKISHRGPRSRSNAGRFGPRVPLTPAGPSGS